MVRADKIDAVKEIVDDLSSTDVVYLVDYRGLSVSEATELRRRLRGVNANLKVVKNTLAKRAIDDAGWGELEGFLEGPTAIAYCWEDPVEPAKVLADFTKEHKKLAVKGGYLRDRVVTPEQVSELAELPTRDELLAKVVGGVAAPLYGLANVMAGPLRGMVTVLEQIRQQKEQEAT